MSDWLTAIKEYEHEFFPERFSDGKLASSLSDMSMPADTRARIAKELVGRPSFDVDAAISRFSAEWWGDENPTGCRLAWEALEAAR